MTRRIQVFMIITVIGRLLIASNSNGQEIAKRFPNLSAPTQESEKTQILVLGTEHLARLGDKFKPAMLDFVLLCLERYNPDVIAVEDMRPEMLEYMYNYGGVYKEHAEKYKSLEYGKAVQDDMKMTRLEVSRKIDLLMKAAHLKEYMPWKIRFFLVVFFVANYDLPSAVLQYSYLPKEDEEDQVTENVLPDSIVEKKVESYKEIKSILKKDLKVRLNFVSILKKNLESQNEIYSIGVKLARRLGLQRIELIDDQQDVDQMSKLGNKIYEYIDYDTYFEREFFKKSQELKEKGIRDNNLLEYYKYINSYEYLSKLIEEEYFQYFSDSIPGDVGRNFISCNEIRNLNIASNIRRCSTFHPGERILVIIGVGHKPFLDNYLNNLMDVKVVQFDDFVMQGDNILEQSY